MRFTFHLHSVFVEWTKIDDFIHKCEWWKELNISEWWTGADAPLFNPAGCICDCIPIERRLHSHFSLCKWRPNESFSLQPWMPYMAALVSCILFQRIRSSYIGFRWGHGSPLYVALLALDLSLCLLYFFTIQRNGNADPMNLLNTHRGSWPGVFIWLLDCLKKDFCDSSRLTQWLSSVVFLISQ